MTESSTDQANGQQPGSDALDPGQFVGAAPAGDASPGEFTSNDQSADRQVADGTDEDTE